MSQRGRTPKTVGAFGFHASACARAPGNYPGVHALACARGVFAPEDGPGNRHQRQFQRSRQCNTHYGPAATDFCHGHPPQRRAQNTRLRNDYEGAVYRRVLVAHPPKADSLQHQSPGVGRAGLGPKPPKVSGTTLKALQKARNLDCGPQRPPRETSKRLWHPLLAGGPGAEPNQIQILPWARVPFRRIVGYDGDRLRQPPTGHCPPRPDIFLRGVNRTHAG